MPVIIAYGDSNTYGYNPATGGRYPVCWTDILSQTTGWIIKNMGACGREIPVTDYGLLHTSADHILFMLGSNDLLDGCSADKSGKRMERFLSGLPTEKITLIAPVKYQRGSWVETDALVLESEKLQDVYAALSEKLRISFINTAGWPIPLSFDGVHYTQEGHRIFAERLLEALTELFEQLY